MLATTTGVDLSQEQLRAVDQLLAFPTQVQTMGGYAGTGKTTVIRTLAAHLRDFRVCAFTGKAANVLVRKGVPASTIHSLIYKPVEERYLDSRNVWRKKTVFKRKAAFEVHIGGFIVDEASMVSRGIYDDLLSFGKPVIFVGDHGQLEPVSDRFNLMQDPDVTLEKIHRNAGEIARFAEFVREGNAPVDWKTAPGGMVRFLPPGRVNEILRATDQAICAYNSTRVAINRTVREQLRRPPDRPVAGDRVMCLQNIKTSGLFNGMQGILTSVGPSNRLTFEAQGQRFPVSYEPRHFNCERAEPAFGTGRVSFEYAWAITCHKAQGDEWDDVAVIQEWLPNCNRARWAYTAASRARQRLTWVAP